MKRSLLLSLTMLCCMAAFAQIPPHYINSIVTQNTINWPFNADNQKVQLLYAPNQFTLPTPAQSGVITSLWFRASTNASNVLIEDLEIKMGQTTATSFSSSTFVAPLTTVHPAADVNITTVTSGTWVELPLTTPFPYNIGQSLIVEVSQTAVTNGFQVHHINTTTARAIFGTTGSSSGTTWQLSTLGAGLTIMFPCTDPHNLNITNITTTSADLDWQYQYPNLKHYEMVVNQTAADPPGTNYQPYATPPLTLNNLTPNTCYYVHIRTNCVGAGSIDSISDTWALDSFCTLPTCDPPPVTIDTAEITSTTALIVWDPVPRVIKYEYAVSIDTIPPPQGHFTTYTQYLQKGLVPQQHYYFFVRAYCDIPSVSPWRMVHFQARRTTGIEELGSGSFALEAYPNPAGNMVTIFAAGRSGNASVSIADMTGKLVRTAAITEDRTVIDLQGLTPGLYFVKYTDEARSEVIKVTKQ